MNAKLGLELIWWGITAFITLAILYPVYTEIDNYPFYQPNIIFIVASLTFTRYIFLLPFTFLARLQLVKIALIFLSIPVVFLLVQEITQFQVFLDEQGIAAVVGEMPLRKQEMMINYVRTEMLLFGVASVVSGALLPFRMMMSVWRYRNWGTV